MSINHFEYRYSFLSSKHPVNITYESRIYPSADNLYWAMIYPDWAEKLSYLPGADTRQILAVITPPELNRMGVHRMVENFRDSRTNIVPEETQVSTMRLVTKLKFDQCPNLRERLIKTNGHKLFNMNTHGDVFWGVVVDDSRTYIGRNWLGKILMDLRAEYLKETAA